MIHLLQIYFQKGTFENPGEGISFWSIFFDFLTTLLGAILGFVGAWWIFRSQIRSDRNKIEQQRQQIFSDKLQYLAALIAEVPRIVKSQGDFYKTFVEETLGNKFKINVPHFVIKTSLTRLTEKVNQEDFFLAYINRFNDPQVRITEIKRFKDIYESVDYFDLLLQQSVESVRELKSRIKNAMEAFRVAVDDAERFAASLFNASFAQDHPVAKDFLGTLFNSYMPQKKENRTNLTFFDSAFLAPLAEEIPNIGGYQIPELNQLALMVRDARIKYNHIDFLSQQQADEFSDYSKELLESLKEFNRISQPLLEINDPKS